MSSGSVTGGILVKTNAQINMVMRKMKRGPANYLRFFNWAQGFVAVAVIFEIGLAHAQNTAGVAPATGVEQAQDLEEIIVTAQKRSENIMRVPVAISAFSGGALNSEGVQTVQDLQLVTPAIVYTNTGAFSQPYIRGVGSRLLANGLDPSVATYLDGRYISRQSAVNFDLADIERIEVLKGPQGVLFGRNSSAGAIRVITKDVANDFEGYVGAGYGDYNLYTVSGVVNVPFTRTLGMRVSGESIKHDGYAQNIVSTGRKEWDDKDSQSIRGKLKWDPNEKFTALLAVGWARRNDESGNNDVALGILPLDTGIARGGITGLDRYQVATAVTNTTRINDFSSELDMTASFHAFDLKSITTYDTLDNKLSLDGDGTSSVVVDALIFENTDTFSQEFNVTSNGDGPLTWLAGAYFFEDNTRYDITLNSATSQGRQTVKTDSEAGFGQMKWAIAGPLSVTVGGRYSSDTKKFQLYPSNLGGVIGTTVPNSGEATFNKFTPAATAQYDFAASMVYAKYAQGFKSGGFNYPTVAGSKALEPEVLKMYELGYKGSLFDRTVTLTLSTYYYDYKDLQVTRAAAAGSALLTTTNAGAAKLYGVDADLTWRVTRDLSLSAALSAEHSKYENFELAGAFEYKDIATPLKPGPGMVSVGFDADGHSLLRAPNFSAAASANYDIAVRSGKIPITVSYAYKGSFDFDFVVDPSSNSLHQNGYSIVNARIGYLPNAGKWSGDLWVDNLTNTKYFRDVVASGTGIRGSYGEPITFGANIKFSF